MIPKMNAPNRMRSVSDRSGDLRGPKALDRAPPVARLRASSAASVAFAAQVREDRLHAVFDAAIEIARLEMRRHHVTDDAARLRRR